MRLANVLAVRYISKYTPVWLPLAVKIAITYLYTVSQWCHATNEASKYTRAQLSIIPANSEHLL